MNHHRYIHPSIYSPTLSRSFVRSMPPVRSNRFSSAAKELNWTEENEWKDFLLRFKGFLGLKSVILKKSMGSFQVIVFGRNKDFAIFAKYSVEHLASAKIYPKWLVLPKKSRNSLLLQKLFVLGSQNNSAERAYFSQNCTISAKTALFLQKVGISAEMLKKGFFVPAFCRMCFCRIICQNIICPNSTNWWYFLLYSPYHTREKSLGIVRYCLHCLHVKLIRVLRQTSISGKNKQPHN